MKSPILEIEVLEESQKRSLFPYHLKLASVVTGPGGETQSGGECWDQKWLSRLLKSVALARGRLERETAWAWEHPRVIGVLESLFRKIEKNEEYARPHVVQSVESGWICLWPGFDLAGKP